MSVHVDTIIESHNIWYVAADGSWAFPWNEVPRGHAKGGEYYQIAADSKEQAYERLEELLGRMADVRGRTRA